MKSKWQLTIHMTVAKRVTIELRQWLQNVSRFWIEVTVGNKVQLFHRTLRFVRCSRDLGLHCLQAVSSAVGSRFSYYSTEFSKIKCMAALATKKTKNVTKWNIIYMNIYEDSFDKMKSIKPICIKTLQNVSSSCNISFDWSTNFMFR